MNDQVNTTLPPAAPEKEASLETRRIEDIVAAGELATALERMESFLALLDSKMIDLTHMKARESQLRQEYVVAQKISASENAMRVNQITDSFLQFAYEFKREILRTFRIADLPVISHKFTDESDIVKIVTEQMLYGRYTILKLIPGGNSGLFFHAKNRQTQQDVVLKVLKIMKIESLPKEELARVVKLKHRNIIKIVDQNFERLPAFVLLEFVNGTKLDDALRMFGAFPPDDALEFAMQLLDAIDYIRKRNIRHSNIRPSKIYIDEEGMPMISSLDVIKSDQDDLRSLSRFKEECRYLSPEALDETLDTEKVDAIGRSDQFSLGLILLELMTARPMFQGQTVAAIFADRRAFFKDPSKRIDAALRDLPSRRQLDRVLTRMLAHDPRDRFANLSEALQELRKIKNRLPVDCQAWASYYHCCRHHHNMIDVFYERFFKTFPDLKEHFKNPERQQMMLRQAVGVILDIDKKQQAFRTILQHPSHGSFNDLASFRGFLETLRDTVRDLVGDYWKEDSMAEAWNGKIRQALEIVEEHLREQPKSPNP
jgi:serine/threonine protein kinase